MANDCYGDPLLVRDEKTVTLRRSPLGAGDAGFEYNEDYVRNLAFEHPSCLPIAEIDSAFRDPVPICKELRTPAGPIDALFVTQDGRLVVVEAKLWRNPEARRKVIGQILDYASALSQWGYEDLQREVAVATGRKGNALFEIVRERHADLDEARFVDSVSRSLRQGRFLLLIVGDGIREGAASIAEFVQRVGSLEFTFGLVELALYRHPSIGLFVQPRLLAKTEIIQRSIVAIREGRVEIEDDVQEQGDVTEISDSARWYEEFWTELMEGLRFDDPKQPMAKVTPKANLFFAMPPGRSQAWLSAYFIQARGHAGVYLTFRRGALGDRLYGALHDDREDIEKEVGLELSWADEGNGKYYVSVYRTYGDARNPECREAIKALMADALNRFVNTFRPRLKRLIEDGGE